MYMHFVFIYGLETSLKVIKYFFLENSMPRELQSMGSQTVRHDQATNILGLPWWLRW